MAAILTDVSLNDIPGFKAAAVACGLKWSGAPDLVIVATDAPASAAGVYTLNKTCAAPVRLCRERTPSAKVRALVINAGNANACTGAQGLADARAMAELTARALAFPEGPESVLVASTGIIGAPMPMDKVEKGVSEAARLIRSGGGGDPARAILTTDLAPKTAAVRAKLPDGTAFVVAGIAKGSGMIAPHMATMIAVVITDLAVDSAALQAELARAADRTFNRVTVDGDTSTNDCCFLLASGKAGNAPLAVGKTGPFRRALEAVCVKLAQDIAKDGEGATKFVTVNVVNAASARAAAAIGRTISESPLVKCAFAGEDPNWGRIVAAAGRAGVPFDPDAASLRIGGVVVFDRGVPAKDAKGAAKEAMKAKEFEVTLDCGLGKSKTTFWTCDLTHGYIKINAEYHT
jgi:glutamate N-acetyltransferase / amino-acid N-acetyltransferase